MQPFSKAKPMNKNILNVMVGVVGGVLMAEFLLKKTPVGKMLGLA